MSSQLFTSPEGRQFTRTCEFCKFWKERLKSVNEIGECRRYAPVLVERDGHLPRTAFPETEATSFCGEHFVDNERAIRKWTQVISETVSHEFSEWFRNGVWEQVVFNDETGRWEPVKDGERTSQSAAT